MKMTRDEFLKDWARRSQSTLEDLETIGLIAIPCDCGDRRCLGWQMRNVRHMMDDDIDALGEPYSTEARRLRLKLLGQEE